MSLSVLQTELHEGPAWSFWAATLQGRRERQEDAYAIHAGGMAAAVFDGVGGRPHGGAAAREAARSFPLVVRDGSLQVLERRVHATGGLTTCTAVLLGPCPRVLAVGDSSAYALAPGGARLLVERDRDRDGALRDGLGFPMQGGHDIPFGGDRILLCTDGVDVAGEQAITTALRQADGNALGVLMDAVLEQGAPDNATAVLAKAVRGP